MPHTRQIEAAVCGWRPPLSGPERVEEHYLNWMQTRQDGPYVIWRKYSDSGHSWLESSVTHDIPYQGIPEADYWMITVNPGEPFAWSRGQDGGLMAFIASSDKHALLTPQRIPGDAVPLESLTPPQFATLVRHLEISDSPLFDERSRFVRALDRTHIELFLLTPTDRSPAWSLTLPELAVLLQSDDYPLFTHHLVMGQKLRLLQTRNANYIDELDSINLAAYIYQSISPSDIRQYQQQIPPEWLAETMNKLKRVFGELQQLSPARHPEETAINAMLEEIPNGLSAKKAFTDALVVGNEGEITRAFQNAALYSTVTDVWNMLQQLPQQEAIRILETLPLPYVLKILCLSYPPTSENDPVGPLAVFFLEQVKPEEVVDYALNMPQELRELVIDQLMLGLRKWQEFDIRVYSPSPSQTQPETSLERVGNRYLHRYDPLKARVVELLEMFRQHAIKV